MSTRTDAVMAMTEHEQAAALAWLAGRYPRIFDEVLEDVEHQRRIRAKREDRSDEGSGERG